MRRAVSTIAPAALVFNRGTKRHQRDAAATRAPRTIARQTDYLRDAVAEGVADRLLDITRRFPIVLDVGAGCGHIARAADPDKVDLLVQLEPSRAMLVRDAEDDAAVLRVATLRVQGDEELLPFADNSLDAAVSSLSLHWVNDLPGAFAQISRALKPDAPFIGAMLGGSTLYELRTSLQQAEQERHGGLRQHVSPMADVSDLAGLLGRGGFTLTTVDQDRLTINYPSMFELVADLKDMGESNAVANRANFVGKDTLMAAAATYAAVYKNPDGSIPATFEVFYMIGWKPSESQPKPKKRGSGKVSLKSALDPTAALSAPSSAPTRT